MASLTVRQIEEQLKQQLRLRAARNGRSVEDEVRNILRAATAKSPQAVAATSAGNLPAAVAKPMAVRGPVRSAASASPSVLLIIGGGIAAYKSLDLIRRLRERGYAVRCVLTKAAQEFVTPLSVGALVGERVFTDLFDPHSEFDVGHIRLAREADIVVVAPATADLMAKMAGGHADDLATAVLLATGAPILLAPAMNPHMWENAATRRSRRAACRRWGCLRRPGGRRNGGERRGRNRTHVRAARYRRCRRSAVCGRDAAAGRQARAGHVRTDP